VTASTIGAGALAGDAGRGDRLAVLDEAPADRVGAELAQLLEEEPVAGRPLALQQPGGAEHQGAGADRGRPLGPLVDPAQPGEDALVLHQRPVAFAAGDEDDVGLRHLVEGEVGAEPKRAAVGPHLPLGGGDEPDLPPRHRAKHLVGPDRVEGGELVEDEDGDLHGGDPTSRLLTPSAPVSRRDRIKLSEGELLELLEGERVAVVSSLGPRGWPHSMPMWFVPREGEVWIWTYAKSQKVRNLERDPRATVLVETGHEYGELRGAMIEAEAEIHRDFETVIGFAEELTLRYAEGISSVEGDAKAALEAQAPKRVAIHFKPVRTATWDHRKLGGTY
jgi:PPOX class probable F420-dependent enzyme